jgi:hypothetical protein
MLLLRYAIPPALCYHCCILLQVWHTSHYQLKIKSEMQSWFRRPFWPLVIFFFKTIRHFSEIRTAGNTKRWFYKKSILKKFNVIANPISVEYNETITHLIAVFILICLPHRRYVYCCVKTFPKIPLISNTKTMFSDITRKFLFCCSVCIIIKRINTKWPGMFPGY